MRLKKFTATTNKYQNMFPLRFKPHITRYAKHIQYRNYRGLFSTNAFPETQRAIVIKEHGASDVLTY